MYQLKGKVFKVGDTRQVSDKFKVRDLVVFVPNESNPDWPDYVTFSAKQDYCDMLGLLKKDDEVNVAFFLGGRKWNDKDGVEKFFTDLTIKDIDRTDKAGKTMTLTKAMLAGHEAKQEPRYASAPPAGDEGDDLPF